MDVRIHIDVISDAICPWCFIGKRRLDKALALALARAAMEGRALTLDVTWRPFFLDPTTPPEGLSMEEAATRKGWDREKAKTTYAAIAEEGVKAGIDFAFDKIQRTPNTLDAHRLIRWAHSAGVQASLVDRLFCLYFLEGEDIGQRGVLINAARACGMDAGLVTKLFNEDADVELTQKEVGRAQELGIEGVPAFIFQGRAALLGAQEPNVIVAVIEKIYAALTGAEDPAEGEPEDDDRSGQNS